MSAAVAVDLSRRRRLVTGLALAAALLSLLGLAVGSDGWWFGASLDGGAPVELIVGQIRAPRTLGALLVGALLGLAGAIAQGLFRNPLADPYLLGTGSGASLAVVVVVAASAASGHALGLANIEWLTRVGLVVAAFVGALAGVGLTLSLARGAHEPLRLLLAGVVVGVVLGAAADLITTWSPEAMRGKQSFLLGSTGFLGWQSVALLAGGLALVLPPAWRLARALDALGLGEDSAASLGLDLPRLRMLLVVLLALATALAVSQAGLVGFVGLVSPHLVRRFAPAPQRFMLPASAAAGGVLMLGADILARGLIAPQELPVGVLTAVLGGGYLLWLLHKRGIGS